MKGKIHSKSLSRYLAVQAIFNHSFGFDHKQIEKEFVSQNDFKFHVDLDFDDGCSVKAIYFASIFILVMMNLQSIVDEFIYVQIHCLFAELDTIACSAMIKSNYE